MKKIISFFILASMIVFSFSEISYASDEQYFIVTAYYSPLPNQSYYFKGDYEKETRLNGMGVRGASWTPVFEGMLAAPAKYAFWTKIKLEGIGIGSVEDRGWAIVEAWKRGYEYDRIDIWMGYGLEGLKRALTWGKRTIKGKILSSDTIASINIANFPTPENAISQTIKVKDTAFSYSIGKNSPKEHIILLQSFLQEIGKYKGEINGVYNQEVIDIVYDFQIQNNIVKSAFDLGAGYWWTKTKSAFKAYYENNAFEKTQAEISITEKLQETKEKNEDEIENKIFDTYIHPNSSKEDIELLQVFLQEIWKYSWEINGNYNDIQEILINYQLENNIINSRTEVGTGYFWPKTRAQAKKDYTLYQEEQAKQLAIEEKERELRSEANEIAIQKIESIGLPKYGEISHAVRNLQKELKELWYFDYKDTAIFWDITKQSIFSFQKAKGLVRSESDIGAWKFWPVTQEALKKDISEKIFSRIKEENLAMK